MAFRKDDTMRLTITIECDNAAFYNEDAQSDAGPEIARILRRYAGEADIHTLVPGDETTLRDINGNTVGQAKITKGRR